MKIRIPFVVMTRKKYDTMLAEISALKTENNNIINNACIELHKRDATVAAEREALVGIYNNIRSEVKE